MNVVINPCRNRIVLIFYKTQFRYIKYQYRGIHLGHLLDNIYL